MNKEKTPDVELLAALQNSRAVRWYVMVLPSCHRGRAKGLQKELDRRLRCNEPAFEFFAPSYVEVKQKGKILVNTEHPLLYNYVFIRSSENELYRMKQVLPWYNFYPGCGKRGAITILIYLTQPWKICNGLPVHIPTSFLFIFRSRGG